MEDFLDRVLELAARSAEGAEVFAVDGQETPVSFEANRLKSVQTRQTHGVSLRLIKNGQIGFASTTRLDDAQALVDTALEVAPFGARAEFEFPAAQAYAGVDVYNDSIADLPVERMVEAGRAVIAQALEAHGDLLIGANLKRRVNTVTLRNSAGGGGSFRKTAFSVNLDANRVRGTDMLDVYEAQESSCALPDFDALAQAVVDKVRLAERGAAIASGNWPVILTPKAFYLSMLETLQIGFNGKLVLEGASPLAGKLGEPLFDPRFQLFDDGLVPGALASAPFDGEGVPTRRTALIEGGQVRAFLYDLQTARRAGTHSTGNAARAFGTLPNPGPHAWLVEPGDRDLAAMVAGIDQGLLVDQVMGAWAGNVIGGDFSGNVHLGYKIERGELVGRVKDTMFAGNVYAALREGLAAVGSTPYWVGGGLRLPHLMFKSLAVASKG